jgi:hypothetical protein
MQLLHKWEVVACGRMAADAADAQTPLMPEGGYLNVSIAVVI